MMLHACKWDPQVGDVATLAPFPLLLTPAAWQELAAAAEQLASELMPAERALIDRPDLHAMLGIPWRLRAALRNATRTNTSRVLRFDFHWTDTGWRISEVNSDVPGGYSEASELPAMMADHFPAAAPAGHPGDAWAAAITRAAGGGAVALLAAPGFMEDQQVVAYLAQRLQHRDINAHRAAPSQLQWRDSQAYLGEQPLAAVVRFVQAEWLPPRQFRSMLASDRTTILNAPTAILSESKSLPLVWDALNLPMTTWRALLPATANPRRVDLHRDERWLLKSAYCNTGDTVAMREHLTAKQWQIAVRTARWNARAWIAQEQFRTLPIASPMGDIFPCIGVYTVDGRAAGIYGRIGATPLIDFAAIDVAVLIADSEAA